MKRTISCLSAAVFVLVLFAAPAMACHGTIGKQFKDERNVDYWEYCVYIAPGAPDPYLGAFPVGPAVHFGDEVFIHYVGEQDFTATDRLVKGVHKVTWKRNVDGMATVYSVPTGGGPEMLMMRGATQLTVTTADTTAPITTPIDLLPLVCSPAMPTDPDVLKIIADTTGKYKLYSGPFVVNEVVKDIGNDSGCFDANNPVAVNFLDCAFNTWLWDKIDYLSYSSKIKGPKGYNWTMTIREPGKICFDDKYMDAVCFNF